MQGPLHCASCTRTRRSSPSLEPSDRLVRPVTAGLVRKIQPCAGCRASLVDLAVSILAAASSAKLAAPYAAALDSSGSGLYIADFNLASIRYMSGSLVMSTPVAATSTAGYTGMPNLTRWSQHDRVMHHFRRSRAHAGDGGTPTAARLFQPTGTYWDGTTLWITEVGRIYDLPYADLR